MAYSHLEVVLVRLILCTNMVFFLLLGLGDNLILPRGHSLSSYLIRMLKLLQGLFLLMVVVYIGEVPILRYFGLLVRIDYFLLLSVL